jgi:hypothetical protein
VPQHWGVYIERMPDILFERSGVDSSADLLANLKDLPAFVEIGMLVVVEGAADVD